MIPDGFSKKRIPILLPVISESPNDFIGDQLEIQFLKNGREPFGKDNQIVNKLI